MGFGVVGEQWLKLCCGGVEVLFLGEAWSLVEK